MRPYKGFANRSLSMAGFANPFLFCSPDLFHHSGLKMNFLRFCKNWTLPIAMAMGVILYFVYVSIPFLAPTKPFVTRAIDIVQPVLIFLMLFLTFCKISLHDLKLCAWHLRLLLIQGISFVVLGLLLVIFPDFPARILVEGAMICLICPTATAAAVVTRKLGGDAAHLTTYTI